MRIHYPALLTVSLLIATMPAAAQRDVYPARPVRLIVPYPPGGGNDIIGRAVAERLSERLGQQVIIDNRGGAATAIGAEVAARAPADGYTLLQATASTLAVNPNVRKKLPYHPQKDFEPISMLAVQPYLLALHPSLPARNVRELIALARKSPGKLNFSSPGTATSGHLAGELLASMAELDIVHVPYKGAGPALVDLIAGQVALMFATVPSVLPHHRSGKLRGIAVSGAKRSLVLPDTSTVAEAGLPGFDIATWSALVAPRGTPQAIIERLTAEVRASLQQAVLRERLTAQGAEPASSTPRELAARIENELARYAKLIKRAGLSVD